MFAVYPQDNIQPVHLEIDEFGQYLCEIALPGYLPPQEITAASPPFYWQGRIAQFFFPFIQYRQYLLLDDYPFNPQFIEDFPQTSYLQYPGSIYPNRVRGAQYLNITPSFPLPEDGWRLSAPSLWAGFYFFSAALPYTLEKITMGYSEITIINPLIEENEIEISCYPDPMGTTIYNMIKTIMSYLVMGTWLGSGRKVAGILPIIIPLAMGAFCASIGATSGVNSPGAGGRRNRNKS